MDVPDNLVRAHNKAKIALLYRKDCVFITTVLFSLQHIWDDKMPTAYTDGETLGINPIFYSALSHKQKQTLQAHEAYHVAFNHMVRGRNLDFKVYNQAADYVINLMLLDAKFEPIKGWLCDEKYRGMSADKVYKLLIKDRQDGKPPPSPSPSGQGGSGLPDFDGGDIIKLPEDSDDESEKHEAIKEIIVRASIAKSHDDAARAEKGEKSLGDIPSDIEELIEGYTNPKLPWHVILNQYMTEFDKSDYSFRTPNRRFMPHYYLPSPHGESMAEIALAFDTSCSVTHNELKQYKTEAQEIINRLEPLRTTITTFDCQLQDTYILEKGEGMDKVKMHGRGGTDLQPAFDYYKKHPPTVLLVFSDLECNPVDNPDFPVIWICVGGGNSQWAWKPDFGTFIEYPLEIDW